MKTLISILLLLAFLSCKKDNYEMIFFNQYVVSPGWNEFELRNQDGVGDYQLEANINSVNLFVEYHIQDGIAKADSNSIDLNEQKTQYFLATDFQRYSPTADIRVFLYSLATGQVNFNVRKKTEK